MLEIIRELIQLVKEKKQEEKYRAQLMKMPLNFEALEHLASKYKDKTITVHIQDGATITIEPKNVNVGNYKSFRQKFDEARQS